MLFVIDRFFRLLATCCPPLPVALAGLLSMLMFTEVAAQSPASRSAAIAINFIEPESQLTAATQSDLKASLFNPFDGSQYDMLITAALQQQEAGDHEQALESFDKAWQITRVANGLLHDSQIPVVQSMIVSEIELQNWESVDDKFSYLEHLYRRLYDLDDPRLEAGLQRVSSWHINAFNANVDGKPRLHLQRARRIFRTRLEVAERTLEPEDPKFAFLHESLSLTEQYLYLTSERYKEQLRLNARASRDPLLAALD